MGKPSNNCGIKNKEHNFKPYRMRKKILDSVKSVDKDSLENICVENKLSDNKDDSKLLNNMQDNNMIIQESSTSTAFDQSNIDHDKSQKKKKCKSKNKELLEPSDNNIGIQKDLSSTACCPTEVVHKSKKKKKHKPKGKFVASTDETKKPLDCRPDDSNNKSCESLRDVFSQRTAADTWELLEIKKMISDPFLNVHRRQYYNERILELNENILKDVYDRIQSGENDIFVLEKLHTMSEDDRFTADQRVEFKCILSALKNKITKKVLEDARGPSYQYDEVMERLNTLLALTFISEGDKMEINEKIARIEELKFKNKKKGCSYADYETDKLMDDLKKLMMCPFLSSKSKNEFLLNLKLIIDETKIEHNIDMEEFEGDDVTNLHTLLKSPQLSNIARMKVTASVDQCKKHAWNRTKKRKAKICDELKQTTDRLLFNGTNLEFIPGYGVTNPTYVKCVKIWNPRTD